MAKEQLQWTSPSPLWLAAAGAADTTVRRSVLRQPAILRFASDTFMNDFLNLLETDPLRLANFVAQPETWRGPTVGVEPVKPVPAFARRLNRLGLVAARQKQIASALVSVGPGASSLLGQESAAQASGAQPKFKLYQPAHQRYYLVTSCLVCGRAGLPDHAINPGRGEHGSFVLRRMFPPGRLDANTPLPVFNANAWEEYAFVTTANGSGWRRIPKEKQSAGGVLIDGEEQLPLFSMNFAEDGGRLRRLFAGLIPVGKREAYMAASFLKQQDDPEPAIKPRPPVEPRMILGWSQVTEPWKRLLERADAAKQMQNAPQNPLTKDEPLSGGALTNAVKATREQIQTGSWYIQLDFARFLKAHVNRVWKALNEEPVSPSLSPTTEQPLFDALTKTKLDSDLANDVQGTRTVPANLGKVLIAALAAEQTLETVTVSYKSDSAQGWPSFVFPLADSVRAATVPDLAIDNADPKDTAIDLLEKKLDKLASLIEAALPPQPTAETPAVPLAAQAPMDMREGWFVIRCVFERPECGPIDPPLLSAPTRQFQMASFFDPDAPARPIRIALPLDTSPAGLRKFDKNTAFMISDMLCGQINRLKGLSLGDLIRSVLPFPLHKDLSVPDGGPCTSGGLEVGMICSLSIPIITICALLLLMIIVSLLDIIFRWMPYFLICFPLPKFKAKG